MQQIFGPRYCETPAVFAQGMFPVEPFNTYSNLVIIFFAILGFGVTLRRAPRAADLHIRCVLLLATGLGSFFWHGLRERWALSADVWSGVLFLMALFFLWARRVMPLMQAIIFFVAFFLVTKISDEINLISYGRWASMMPAIMLFGGYMIYRTVKFSTPAAVFGTIAVVSSLTALTFRTVDRFEAICSTYPVGTHFLWHIFLSAAAFLGILAIVFVIRSGRTIETVMRRAPVGAPAE